MNKDRNAGIRLMHHLASCGEQGCSRAEAAAAVGISQNYLQILISGLRSGSYYPALNRTNRALGGKGGFVEIIWGQDQVRISEKGRKAMARLSQNTAVWQ